MWTLGGEKQKSNRKLLVIWKEGKGRSERELDGVHMIKAHGLIVVEPLICTVENAKRDQLARLPSQAKASRLELQGAAGPQVSKCRVE